MISKALYKISVISPLNVQDKQITETKMSYKISQYQRSTSSKVNTSLEDYRKPVSLSFNLGRIKPKTISHDKQTLYEQNMRLKESIKYLNNQVIKLRTRANISQHQAYKVIEASYTDLTKSNSNKSIEKVSNTNSKVTIIKHKSPKISWMYLQSQNSLRQQLKKSKQQIQFLQQQNEKLRKSLKYTQISEITIQNQRIMDECLRLRKELELATSKGVKEYTFHQKEYESMKIQIEKLRENNKYISLEIKNKMRQVEIYQQELEKAKEKEAILLIELKTLKQSIKQQKEKSGMKIGEECEKIQEKNKVAHNQDSQIEHKASDEPNKKKSRDVDKLGQKTSQPQTTSLKSKKQSRQNIQKKQQQQNPMIFHHKNRRLTQSKSKQQLKQTLTKTKEDKEKHEKQRKIKQQEIRQILTYRFQSQRYLFEDFVKDIHRFNIDEFVYEQLRGLLMAEPFLLDQQQQQVVFQVLYGSENRGKLKTQHFLQRIKHFINDFILLQQQKQQNYLQKWQTLLKQHEKRLRNLTKLNKQVSKQQFEQFLIQTYIKRQQIQVLIGEAAMVSNSLKQINIQAFFNKMVS